MDQYNVATVVMSPSDERPYRVAPDNRMILVGATYAIRLFRMSKAMTANISLRVLSHLLSCLAGLLIASVGYSQGTDAVDDSFFVDKLYPKLTQTQCQLCHNDNGVATETTLEFPSRSASREQIAAFGYVLGEYVNKTKIDESPLLTKPTAREEHTGGQRILQGSPEEQLLLQWIKHLSTLSKAEEERAQKLIERTRQWKLEPLSVQRLTHSQYNNTVRDLLNDQSQPANSFPKEDFIHGFKNQLEGQGVSPLLTEAYSSAAERLARAAFRGGDQHKLLPVTPKTHDDADAASAFVKDFGRRLFRRPLSQEENEKYSEMLLAASAAAYSGMTEPDQAAGERAFLSGAQLVLETMLQSPSFLFITNHGKQGPNYAYELVARMSYLLWDAEPDRRLLDLAESGKLKSKEQVEALAKQMLDDPRTIQALDEFLSQWLRFDRVTGATRDRRKFREFNSEIAMAMVEETRLLFHNLVERDENFMQFFDADYTYVNSSLAQLYGLPVPTDDRFTKVAYPEDSGRAGVLGHGSFLVSTSKPAETSPTSRGLFIRNQFLAQEIAPPPPGVNSVLPEISEDKPMTNRQRLEVHLNSEACASCHRLIDPIGYAFEQYDAIGNFQSKVTLRFGTREKPKNMELELDTSAFIQGMEAPTFSQPKELGRILAKSETCQRCIVKQYFRYAFGREETAADQPILDEAFRRFRDSGFHFREIILALVTSDLYLQ